MAVYRERRSRTEGLVDLPNDQGNAAALPHMLSVVLGVDRGRRSAFFRSGESCCAHASFQGNE